MDPTTLKAKYLNAGASHHASRGSTHQAAEKGKRSPPVSLHAVGKIARGGKHGRRGSSSCAAVGSQRSRWQMPIAVMRARRAAMIARASSSHVVGSRLGCR